MPPVPRRLRPEDHRLPALQHRRQQARHQSRRHPARGGVSWVCRHDLAEACHLALTSETIDFDIMHTASHPDADKYCNVARSRELLGLEYKGHFLGD